VEEERTGALGAVNNKILIERYGYKTDKEIRERTE
jgi:hypothetical protein